MKNFEVPRTLGPYLLLAYLISSLIGKSYLEGTSGVWFIYHASNLALTPLILVYALSIRHDKRPEPVFYSSNIHYFLVAFLLWGTLCCASQTNLVENLIPYAMFSGMVIVLCMLAPRLLRGVSTGAFLRILTVLLCIWTLASFVSYIVGFPPASDGRIRGVYNNSLTCANMMIITSVLCLWFLLCFKPRPLATILLLALLAISFSVLNATRTRSGYICLFVAMTALVAHSLSYKRKYIICALFMLWLVTMLAIVISMPGYEEQIWSVRKHARIEAPLAELPAQRTTWWKPGIEQDLNLGNILGKGFLGAYEWELGQNESGYNRDLNRHNTFLSCAQSYGIIGLILFIAFLVVAARWFWLRKDMYGTLGFSLLIYSVVNGLCSNQLLGFGSPVDRLSWLLIGIALNVPLLYYQKGHLTSLFETKHTPYTNAKFAATMLGDLT